MQQHTESSKHAIAMGVDDLSFWCYACKSYLHHLNDPKVSIYMCVRICLIILFIYILSIVIIISIIIIIISIIMYLSLLLLCLRCR